MVRAADEGGSIFSLAVGHFSYNDRFAGHQPTFVDDGGAVPFSFPDWFDADFFDDAQLDYLGSFMVEYRGEVVRKVLELLMLQRDGWIERAAVLDKLINRPELSWREAPAFYGVSNHRFFEAKNMLERVFGDMGERMVAMLRARENRTAHRPEKEHGQLELDLWKQ